MSIIGTIRNALALLAATAALAAPAQASHSTIEAKCTDGDIKVYVIDYDGDLAMYVYRGGRRVAAEWADKRVIEDGATVTRVGYAAGGSVFDGGLDLRIRTRDDRIPANEGSATLTHSLDGRVANERLACTIY